MSSPQRRRGYFPDSPSQSAFMPQQSIPRGLNSPSQTSFLSASYDRLNNEPERTSTASVDSGLSSYSIQPGNRSEASSLIQPMSRRPSNRSDVPLSPTQSRGGRQVHSVPASISDKFSLSADPAVWGSSLQPEPDDALHNFDRRERDTRGTIFTWRGLSNVGCVVLLALCLIGLFAGYPVAHFYTTPTLSTLGGFNVGGINSSGQIPTLAGSWGLIDVDTPAEAHYITAFNDGGKSYQLVFSDEFNTDGRTFYPGDDPYWEAVDLHYWQTGNLEWYDPAAITTKGGALQITFSKMDTHGLDYQGGMFSTWNKFCFTGGILLASVSLPGLNNVLGLWPAVWSMGNLGRAGYGASLEGMWPYSYDNCDVGTAPNQTINQLPAAALINGDPYNDNALSYLPGQRLSRCTCPGESHPGPVHADKTYVGRSAPEIDVFEADISSKGGTVSQSGQWAPFNEEYIWQNTSANLIIANPSLTTYNNYRGGAYQQATSCVTLTNQSCYEQNGGCFSTYGFEYKPGYDGAYISWIASGQIAWTLNDAGMGADTVVEISQRPVSQEPMYLLANLGSSQSFGYFDPATTLDTMLPATMSIDWVRVYQDPSNINIGCDPPDFPTQAYINQYIEAYTNPNLTTWVDDYGQPFPKNSLVTGC